MPEWTSNLGVSIKSLADGQVATSKGTIYTAPTGKTAVVTNVKMVNTSSGPVKVNLYFKASGGTSRRIDLEIEGGGLAIMDNEQTMEAGDIIEADATSGSTIDYSVNGVERV